MCLKLDDGAVLFSSQDMLRLRSRAAGAMGSTTWAARGEGVGKPGPCTGASQCECARAEKQGGE